MGSTSKLISHSVDEFGTFEIGLTFTSDSPRTQLDEVVACIEHQIELLMPELVPAIEGISPRVNGATDIHMSYETRVGTTTLKISFWLLLNGIELGYEVCRELIQQTYASFHDHALSHLLDPRKDKLREEVEESLANTTFQLMCGVNDTTPKEALRMSMSSCVIAVHYIDALPIAPVKATITELLEKAKVELTPGGAVVSVGGDGEPLLTGQYL